MNIFDLRWEWIRGETIDNEIEISSEHEKVYINMLFSKKFEAIFKDNKNLVLLRQNVTYIMYATFCRKRPTFLLSLKIA